MNKGILIIFVLFVGCGYNKKGNSAQYIAFSQPPVSIESCQIRKEIFNVGFNKKWADIGVFTYDQTGKGVLFSYNANDSTILVQDLIKRNSEEIKIPFSLVGYNYFFYKDEYFYFLQNDYWLMWKINSPNAEKKLLKAPHNFEFQNRKAFVDQPFISPNGKSVILSIADKNKRFILDYSSLDAVVNIESGESKAIPIGYSSKTKQGKFLPVYYYSREWLTDSTIVYSFGIDENLYVVNINSGITNLYDGRSKYQTELIKPHENINPSDDEYAEYSKYKDYYPRMFGNRATGELYRVYKKRLAEKNAYGEYNTRANMEYSIIVFDSQLNKKCEIDVPFSEKYVWRFVPSPKGFFYNMFINPNDSVSYEKIMQIDIH